MKTRKSTHREGADVVLVGLGNIGSFSVVHLGHLAGIKRVVLVDRDHGYDRGNLRGQDITPTEVDGASKALIQSRRLRRVNPNLDVQGISADLRNVPWGAFRARVILGALDSLEARMELGEIAWRWGVPYIDGGVDPLNQLIRVTVYWPGNGSPCFECALSDADYLGLAQHHPCAAAAPGPAPTNGTSSLGAVVAGLMAIECEKILAGQKNLALAGRQLVIDLAHHRHCVTALGRHAHCQFDHRVWEIAPFRGLTVRHTVGELLRLAQRALPGGGPVAVRVPGKLFVKALHCLACGHCHERFHLTGRLPASLRPCPHCGGRRWDAVGFKSLEWLDSQLPGSIRVQTLHSVGIRPGEVLQLRSGKGESHLVIRGDEE